MLQAYGLFHGLYLQNQAMTGKPEARSGTIITLTILADSSNATKRKKNRQKRCHALSIIGRSYNLRDDGSV
jgi:hypothetical protein